MGGPIQSVHLLNKFLAKQGVEITVYTTNVGLKDDKNLLLGEKVEIDGVKVFYFPYYGYIHYTFSPSLFLALVKNIRKFDLIHITGVWNFPVCAAAFWARFYKKPYIISPRGSLMKNPLAKKGSFKKKIYLWFFSKRDLRKAIAIHFTTEAEKEDYLKAGLPLKKAIIIPNSFDMAEFEKQIAEIFFRNKFNISDDKKIILFLGRLNWIKGLDTLISAFAEVIKKESKAVLILAGPDDEGYKKNIQLLITNYQLQNNVIFTGILLNNDKIAAFRESDVFVLPSYSENFGMAAVEAMICGLPVVITRGVGISGEVEKADAGLVVEKDVNQVAEAILKILNNPELAKKMGENGRRLVEQEFSSEKVAESFLKEYNEILKEYEKK